MRRRGARPTTESFTATNVAIDQSVDPAGRCAAEQTLDITGAGASTLGRIRVHRSHIVNLAEVREVRREDERRLRVVLSDGSEVVASRSGSTRLRERF